MAQNNETYRVGVIRWQIDDAIADAIAYELHQLGHSPTFFLHDQPIPTTVDVLFSFAPYNRLMQIPYQLAQLPEDKRPFFLHWNIENGPDPQIPWAINRRIAGVRSWIDRLHDNDAAWSNALQSLPPVRWIDSRLTRYRLIGEYHYAYRAGLLNLLFESSRIYTDQRQAHGIPAIFVPWGTVPSWYEDMQLTRDIDVLWMGKRRTKRRSELLDEIDQRLSALGYHVYIADNEVKPFVYGDERTRMLNRAKITLNIEAAPYDNALPYRYHVVAPNRSLVVSETLHPHYPTRPGVHYVAASYEQMVETLIYYLEHDAERQQIVEAAYRLVTEELTFGHAIRTIMDHVSLAIPTRPTAVFTPSRPA